MKISKKTKSVDKYHKDCEFVDKYGRQFKNIGLHLYLYRGGEFFPVSWFSPDHPEKIWRIK